VTQHHFPSGVSDSGYGEYAIHIATDALTPLGFRILSAYEPQSKRTNSRLPFFFGFRVFGRAKGDVEFPLWRELLGQALRQILFQRPGQALLYAAFSLESFIDHLLTNKLKGSGVGEVYTDHILRVAERKYELHALDRAPGLSKGQIDRLYARLNESVFTPRNRLAHGKLKATEITTGMAIQAIKATAEFMWDWSLDARPWLLPHLKPYRFEDLIDNELLLACDAKV